MKRHWKLLVFALMAAMMWACDGTVNPRSSTRSYRLEAVLAKYLSDGSARIDAVLTRNDTLYHKAEITVAGIALDTNSVGYFKVFSSGQIQTGQSYTLNVQDGTVLDVDLTLTLAGTFAINKPGIRNFIGNPITVEWSVSAGTTGYILATRPPDAYPPEDGYESYVTGTSGVVPSEAFMVDAINRMEGTHRLYVVAYTGAPTELDSLPFGIPTTLAPADNVAKPSIEGRVAGLVVADPDSVIVP